jgi:hypothetical protein
VDLTTNLAAMLAVRRAVLLIFAHIFYIGGVCLKLRAITDLNRFQHFC